MRPWVVIILAGVLAAPALAASPPWHARTGPLPPVPRDPRFSPVAGDAAAITTRYLGGPTRGAMRIERDGPGQA